MRVSVLVCQSEALHSVQSVRKVASCIRDRQGQRTVMVIGALSDYAQRLKGLAADVSGPVCHREAGMLSACANQQTAALMALSLSAEGVAASSMLGFQAGISAEFSRGSQGALGIDVHRILNMLTAGITPVIAGESGVTDGVEPVHLGVPGPGLLGVLLASRLGAEHCEILVDDAEHGHGTEKRFPGDYMTIGLNPDKFSFPARVIELARALRVDLQFKTISQLKKEMGISKAPSSCLLMGGRAPRPDKVAATPQRRVA